MCSSDLINLEGLIHGGAYFQNFMVASISLLFFVGEDHFFFQVGMFILAYR